MSSILLKRSLCTDPVDYESLLASLSVVKSVLDCDVDGHPAEGPALDILKKLFKFGDENGNALWYSAEGKNEAGEPLNNVDLDALPYSCFKNTDIYFYGKDCDFNKCPVEVNKVGCIKAAVDLPYPNFNIIEPEPMIPLNAA